MSRAAVPHPVTLIDANKVGRSFESVKELRLATKVRAGQQFTIAAYYPGWAAQTKQPAGGGELVFVPDMPKSNHNGITIFSPTVPWDGTYATHEDYLNRVGETDGSGTGCFVRPGGKFSIDIEKGGAIEGEETKPCHYVIQKIIDIGVRSVSAPQGEFWLAETILMALAKSGFQFRGAGSGRGLTENGCTVFHISSNMLFDTDRLDGLGLDPTVQAEHNKNAVFMMPGYDNWSGNGGTGRASNYTFKDFAVQAEPGFEEVSAVFSSPNLNTSRFVNIQAESMGAMYHAWFTSDGISNHFNMTFKDLQGKDCLYFIRNDYKEAEVAGHAPTSTGNGWILENCKASRCKYPFNLYGLFNSTLSSCDADNVRNGGYGFDIYKCKNITLASANKTESRLNHIGAGYGGGLLRIVESSATVTGGFFIGGDETESGTGVIGDYDDGSGNVSDLILIEDNSVVTMEHVHLRAYVDGSTKWPVTVTNSILYFKQSISTQGAASDMNPGGAGVVHHIDNVSGRHTFIPAGGAGVKFSRMQNYRIDSVDEETLVADGVQPDSAYDVFDLADSGAILPGVVYRVNLGALSTSDYTDVNWPTATGGFGILQRVNAGIYQYIEVSKNNGEVWRSVSIDNGNTWASWNQLV